MPRYTLVRQLHFPADVPDRTDVIVTVQQWASVDTKRPRGIYVVCHNGEQADRRLCSTPTEIAHLVDVLDRTAAKHADDLLSEEKAATEVARRHGPKLGWCHRIDCGEPVPYASEQCADGHPSGSVGRIAFASLAQLNLHTGGQPRG